MVSRGAWSQGYLLSKWLFFVWPERLEQHTRQKRGEEKKRVRKKVGGPRKEGSRVFVGAWHKEARQEDGQLRGWSLFRMRAPTVKVCLNSLLQGAIGSGDEITERFPSGGMRGALL